MEFLSQLRPHLGAEPLCATIDDILENLLKLPQSAVVGQCDGNHSSSSSTFGTECTSDVGSNAPNSSSSGWRLGQGVASSGHASPPSQYLQQTLSYDSSSTSTFSPSYGPQGGGPAVQQSVVPSASEGFWRHTFQPSSSSSSVTESYNSSVGEMGSKS